MLNVGILGIGGIAGIHINGWKNVKNAEVVAICDIRRERLEKFPEYRHYESIDEILEKEKLDIVDICLPTNLHIEAALNAIEHGYNVICEKPISLEAEDVDKIYSAAEKKGVKFMVAHVLRFWPAYELLKEIYDTGKYGKLISGNMQRLNIIPQHSWDNWMRDEKRSGLVPFDLHIHDIDFMVWAFGTPNDSAMLRARRENQDYLSATYKYDDFFITVESTWYAAPKFPFSMSYRFQFEEAVVVFNKGVTIYKNDGTVISSAAEADGGSEELNLPKTGAYSSELIYFASCVENNTPINKIKPEELKEVLRLLHKFGVNK